MRRSWAESTRESAGGCGWRLKVLSNGACCGNWTTVSPGCIDQAHQGHAVAIGRQYLPAVLTSASGSLVIVDAVRVCICKSLFLILTK